jgi:hypothetical protein
MALTNVYTGSSGSLTLANENNADGDDAKAILDAYETQTLGRVTDVQIVVRTRLDEYHEIGRRHASSLHPGDVSITGTVRRAYVNGALLFLLLGRGAGASSPAEPYPHPTFNLAVALADPAAPGNTLTLELKGVKFQEWAYGLPEEDFVMENLSFKALAISVVDKEAPAGGGEPATKSPAFPG